MAFTICTSGSAIWRAGANVNADVIVSGSLLAIWSDAAESEICTQARYDVVTNWTSLTAKGKEVMENIASGMIAKKIIGYEPEAIGTRGATLRLNVIDLEVQKGLTMIRDKTNKTFLGIN